MNNRIYPDPDPMLRYIPVEEAPASFWALPAQERSKRARLHIIARNAGDDPVHAWLVTMDMSRQGQAFADEITAPHTDEAILDSIRRDGGWIAGS